MVGWGQQAALAFNAPWLGVEFIAVISGAGRMPAYQLPGLLVPLLEDEDKFV